jgi:hypothetical protein
VVVAARGDGDGGVLGGRTNSGMGDAAASAARAARVAHAGPR